MRLLSAILVGLILSAPPALAAEPIVVSIIQLIATPKSFDGKRVIVVGVPRIQFEGNCLFLHKEDYEASLAPNALWLSVPRDKYAAWKALEGRYVTVHGTFNAEHKGHLGVYGGALQDITQFDVLSSAKDSR